MISDGLAGDAAVVAATESGGQGQVAGAGCLPEVGLGVPGLKMLRQVGDELGMPVITECLSVRDVEAVAQYSDIIQIGARNMQNFDLLEEAGKTGKPRRRKGA